MASWPLRRIEEICEVTSSKRIYATELVPAGVPFLKSKEIIEKVNGQSHSNPLYISEQRFQEVAEQTGSIEAGDVLLTSRGTLGVPYVVTAADRFHFADGNLTWFRRFKGLYSGYLKFFFLSPIGKAALQNCVIGSSQQAYTIAALKKAEIPLPPLPIQQRIAGILSAYDELIENSQRRIKILEAMARALYREWFVHFRFPGHENNPHVASPLGDIPQGWDVTPFGELYNTSSGGTPSRARPEYFEDGTVCWVKSQELLDGFILTTEERITERALEESSARLFPANTVLIALYGATIGKLAVLSRAAATNQACCAVLPKRPGFGREFAFLTLLLNRERIIGLRLGAAQQNISQVLLRNFECLKPADELVCWFSEQTAPFFDGILTLQRQIQNLCQTRDLLLPRLLSGQIDVEALTYS
jgi:type I restriction enzyme S subunit